MKCNEWRTKKTKLHINISLKLNINFHLKKCKIVLSTWMFNILIIKMSDRNLKKVARIVEKWNKARLPSGKDNRKLKMARFWPLFQSLFWITKNLGFDLKFSIMKCQSPKFKIVKISRIYFGIQPFYSKKFGFRFFWPIW